MKNITPQESLAQRRSQFAYSQTWRGKRKAELRELFQKCKVCATGNIAWHVATCLVGPTLAVVGLQSAAEWLVVKSPEFSKWLQNSKTGPTDGSQTALMNLAENLERSANFLATNGHNPIFMTAVSAAGASLVYGGWYAWKGRGVEPPVRKLNRRVALTLFGLASAYHWGMAYDHAWKQYSEFSPANQAAIQSQAEFSGYAIPLGRLGTIDLPVTYLALANTGLCSPETTAARANAPQLPADIQEKLEKFKQRQFELEAEKLNTASQNRPKEPRKPSLPAPTR